MKKLRMAAGYAAAVAATFIALATFFGMNVFAHKLVDLTGITITPRYSGGEVVNVMARDGYEIRQHRAVFDGLFGERNDGFVQIDFAPLAALPPTISTEIDIDMDGAADLRLKYDVEKNSAQVEAYNPRVVALEGCYVLKERRAVRIQLKKE